MRQPAPKKEQGRDPESEKAGDGGGGRRGGGSEPLPLPFAVSFEKWKSIVSALLQARAHLHPVLAREVAAAAGIQGLTMAANIKFLKALGIASSSSKVSGLSLSRTGESYARALAAGDEKTQREILAGCMAKALKPITRFCELFRTEDLSFDRLFFQIRFLADIEDMWGQNRDTASQYRLGIYTVIEMMVFAGLLDKGFIPKDVEV
jgi:hypothetical protein